MEEKMPWRTCFGKGRGLGVGCVGFGWWRSSPRLPVEAEVDSPKTKSTQASSRLATGSRRKEDFSSLASPEISTLRENMDERSPTRAAAHRVTREKLETVQDGRLVVWYFKLLPRKVPKAGEGIFEACTFHDQSYVCFFSFRNVCPTIAAVWCAILPPQSYSTSSSPAFLEGCAGLPWPIAMSSFFPQGAQSRADSSPRRRSVSPGKSGRHGEKSPRASNEFVQTAVRLRPFLPNELSKLGTAPVSCVEMKPNGHVVLSDPEKPQLPGREFECTFAFDSSRPKSDNYSDQRTIYNSVGAEMVMHGTTGFNCCLVAYGQTGTGKTHTVHGDWQSHEHRGLLPRISEGRLFQRLDQFRAEGASWRVRISYIEVYNDRLRDLLEHAVPSLSRSENDSTALRPEVQFCHTCSVVELLGRATDSSKALVHAGIQSRELRQDRLQGDVGLQANFRILAGPRLEIRNHPAVGVYVENLQALHTVKAALEAKALAQELPVEHLRDVARLVSKGACVCGPLRSLGVDWA
eukprot:s2218_g2.t1